MNSDTPRDYADIIDLPHHQSQRHPHMSLHDRAAQFAPFAALTGHSTMLSQTATDHIDEVNAEHFEDDVLFNIG